MTLREPTLFTLAALRDGPLHGYAIASKAQELSGGRVTLTAGTLYGALDRLVGSGLVEVDREEVVDGRKRRYHRLTEAGGKAVAEELDRLRATLTALDASQARQRSSAAPGRPALSDLMRALGGERSPHLANLNARVSA